MEKIEIRGSLEGDKFHLFNWLMDPEVLPYFPLCNRVEIEDAIRISLFYASMGAAFTAELDGKPVAMANFYLNSFEKIKHQSLFVIVVAKEMRGKGIGRQLLEYLIKVGREKLHLETLHLEVYAGNPAIRLYKRCGFKEYGRHKRFLKEPDGQYKDKVLMELQLNGGS